MITLTRETLQPKVVYNNQHVWPLRVTATADPDSIVDPEVFVYHAAPDDDVLGDVFECIASVMQMTELPAYASVPDDSNGTTVAWYRLPSVEINARSPEHAEELWQIIKTDVQELVTQSKALQEMQVEDTFVAS